jgi:hypothetical protein
MGAVCSVVDEEDESVDHYIRGVLFKHLFTLDDESRENR